METNARYDFVRTPLGSSQYCCIVGLPHSEGTFCLQLPAYHPPIGVAREQTRVAMYDLDAVDVGSVAAEDVAGLGRRTNRLLLLLDVKRHGFWSSMQ